MALDKDRSTESNGLNEKKGAPSYASLPESACQPIVRPIPPETITIRNNFTAANRSAYFKRLAERILQEDFAIVDDMQSDGLYISKRPIRGAEGQGQLLNQAGTVFYHTLLYVKAESQVQALDYGPEGTADVTANIMEPAPCGPVLHQAPTLEPGQKFVQFRGEHCATGSDLMQRAIQFAESRKYHAVHNNCIQNTDFLCRVLTGGRLRNAPLVYDLLAGSVPQQDHPMLLLFFLMTQLSCLLTSAFVQHLGGEAATAPEGTGSRQEPSSLLQQQQVDLRAMLQAFQAGSSGRPPAEG